MLSPAPSSRRRVGILTLVLAVVLGTLPPTQAAPLIWDANTGTTGAQDGAGSWTSGGTTFWDGTNNVATTNDLVTDIAQFGSGGTGGTVNVSTQSINGLIFDATTTTGYTLSAAIAQTLTIGSGGLTVNAGAQNVMVGSTNLLSLATSGNQSWLNNSSSTLTIAGALIPATGNTLTLGGSGNINVTASTTSGNNSGITKTGSGTLTWTSDINTTGALNVDGGLLYFNMTGSASTDMATININNTAILRVANGGGLGSGAVVNVASGATYQNNFNADTIARLIGSGTVTTTNTSATSLNLSSTTDAIFDGIIKDNASNSSGKFAITKQNTNTVTLTGANTYTGPTTIQRGTLALNFASTVSSGPTADIISGASALVMSSTTSNDSARLNLIGADGETNSQTFASTSITGQQTIALTSGAGGTMNVDLKAITIAAGSSLNFIGPASGSIATTNAAGLMGANVLYTSSTGVTSLAKVVGGVVTAASADFIYETGKTIDLVTSYSNTGLMLLDNTSTGNTSLASGTTAYWGTQFTDTAARTMDIGAGNTMQFGSTGGILADATSGNLTIGTAVGSGTITAGASGAGELNFNLRNAASTTTVNSVIANNAGAGVVGVTKTGNGRLVLAGANTFTGATNVTQGVLEIQSSAALGNALGTAVTGTTVLLGSALELSGGITVGNEALSLSGTGISGSGGLRNISGNNTWGGTITFGTTSSIISTAGTLTLDVTSGNAITGGNNSITMGGAGDIVVNDPINYGGSSNGTITKNGTGTLYLNASNTFTGSGNFSISAGAVRISNGGALGTTTGSTSVSSGAALELTGNISTTENFTLNSAGISNTGAIRNLSGSNTLTGTASLSGPSRINADAGTTLTLNNATAAVQPDANGNRTVTLGGDGTINVSGVLRNNTSGTVRALAVTKDGTGTVNLTGVNTYTGATTVSAGTLALGSGGSLGDTKVTVASGATLAVNPGVAGATSTLANTTAANTFTLSSGSTFTMADNATSTFNVAGNASFSSTGETVFNLGGTTTAADLMAVTGTATGGSIINIAAIGSTPLAVGNYDLITAASGLGTGSFTLGTTNVVVNGAVYGLSIVNSIAGKEILTVSATAAEAANAYWKGDIDSSWATQQTGTTFETNFASSPSGAFDTYAKPTGNTNVFMSANTATNLTTTLDANTVINSLTFTGTGTADTAGSTIASGTGTNTLTLNAAAVNGNTAGNGITVAAGAGASTISANVVLGSAQTWTVSNDPAAPLTVSGSITDGGSAYALTKAGTGTLVLSGLSTTASSNYSGTTTLNGGTLRLTNDASMTGGFTIGATATSTVTSALDLSTASATFAGAMNVQTNSTTANAITIGAGESLNINNNVTIGSSNASLTTTKLNVSGDGAFNVTNSASGANFTVGGYAVGTTSGPGNIATADFSGLATMNVSLNTTNGVVRVNNASLANTNNVLSTLILADTSTLTAKTLAIGDGGQFNSVATQVNALKLGSVANTLNFDTINIGSGQRDFGALTFADSTGTVTINSASGTGVSAFNMGATGGGTGTGGATNTFDVTGHLADLNFGAVSIGRQNRGGAYNNVFSFDQGTLDMTTLAMSTRTANPSTGSTAVTTSTMNLGGGTVNITGGITALATASGSLAAGTSVTGTINITGGTVNVGATSGTSITLAGAVANATATAAINLTGGVTTLTGNVVKTGGAGISTATITLNGATTATTLDMTGHNIGSATNQVVLSAQQGTLKNLAELNGGGTLDKTSAGTLIMLGSNNYTGATTVSAGTLQVGAAGSGTTGKGAVSVASGATLLGSGIVQGSSATLSSGASLYIGDTTGTSDLSTLTFAPFAAGGSIDFQAGSTTFLGLNPVGSQSDHIVITGNNTTLNFNGSLVVGPSVISSGLVMDQVFNLLDWTGLNGTPTFASQFLSTSLFSGNGDELGGLDLPDISGTGLFWDISKLSVDGTIMVVPEPTRCLLLLAGLSAIALRRRRRA